MAEFAGPSLLAQQVMLVLTGVIVAAGALDGTVRSARAQDIASSLAGNEVLRTLGEGVVGGAHPARPLDDPALLARWEAGDWTYRITAGPRRGQTERERLTPIATTPRGETWERTVGHEYTLYLRRTADGSLVLPSEVAHSHKALLHFDPPLSYLIAGLPLGERRVFDGKIDVYSASNPATKWYSGKIQAATTYAGVYRVRTPAGTFDAILIRTEYRIDILAVVSVRDTLYTFYAEGIGKVAEAEHRRISAVGLFSSDTKMGRVLVSFVPTGDRILIEAP
jgi:hypothetical protein